MNKKHAYFRMALFMLIFLIVFSIGGWNVSAQVSIDQVRKSVVRIVVRDRGSTDDLINRSGFVVGTQAPFQYVATSWDVGAMFEAEPNREIFIWRARDDLYPARIHIPLRDSNILVLRLDFDHHLYPYEPLTFGERSFISQGDDLYAIGFVTGDARTADPANTSVVKNIFSREVVDFGVYHFSFEDGFRINRGIAGGPLVDKDGHVIGIVLDPVRPGWRTSGGVDIGILTNALEGRNIAYVKAGEAEPPEETEEEEEEAPPPPPEPKPLAQVLNPRMSEEGILSWDAVGEARGYEISLYRDGDKVSSDIVGPGETRIDLSSRIDSFGPGSYSAQVKAIGGGDLLDGPVSTSSNIVVVKGGIFGDNFILLAIGAVALLLIAGAVAFLMKGSKKAATAPSSASSAATQRAAPSVTQAKPEPASAPVTKATPSVPSAGIKGISGQFAGKTIEFVDNQLVIGRDPRMAQLVYPPSKEEISRKHLSIRFDEKTNKFILEDSSSNGTFLSSNQKLESGKPYYLNAGDRFYVADPKEVFELKMGKE